MENLSGAFDEQEIIKLKDYFAGIAMGGIVHGHARLASKLDPDLYELFARHAYLLANAMLKERLIENE
jgi:type IV secretory pathway TrbD component